MMSRVRWSSGKILLAAGLALALPLSAAQAKIAKESVLYTFTGGNDGGQPAAGLISDKQGNFYGTTTAGGPSAAGTVFKLSAGGTESTLYAFTGGSDGAQPYGSLTMDSAGNFYGTTKVGGSFNAGTVFKLAANGSETVLYTFTGGNDGAQPLAGVIRDKKGNLYGTTNRGGVFSAGAVFKLTSKGKESVLHSFGSGVDGNLPIGGLVMDASGNLYGTTRVGGAHAAGTVFMVTPSGSETVLYSFTGGNDGAQPYDSPVLDGVGNLYGTTGVGGASNAGTVFELAPDGTETVLHSFGPGGDGSQPGGSLLRDATGNFYGTTSTGGSSGAGTVFKLAPDGTETVLHSFRGGNDGAKPATEALITDKKGNLYGTTAAGGAGNAGTIFKVTN